MPKLFPIHIEVEEVAVGRVMRVLNTLAGVAKINFDFLEKREHTFGTNGAHRTPRGPYKKFDETGMDTVTKLLNGRTPMPTAELKAAFIDMGRSPASINSVIHTMLKAGELVNTKDGYTLSKKVKDRLRHRVAAKRKTRR